MCIYTRFMSLGQLFDNVMDESEMANHSHLNV